MKHGKIVATPTKTGNMDVSLVHQHNQSTNRWERASTRMKFLQTLSIEKPLPITKLERVMSKLGPIHKNNNYSLPEYTASSNSVSTPI